MFSKEWEEEQYSKGKQINRYPFTDLISLVKRFGPESGKVLELGCGTGPNIRFFLDEGYNYYGVEGSKFAVQFARKKYNIDGARILREDFTKDLPHTTSFFDLIVDRSSLTHNVMSDIVRTIDECHRVLRKDGIMIMVDCFSVKHDEFQRGVIIEPGGRSYVNGPLKNVGKVKFFTVHSLTKLFDDKWKIEYFAEKVREVSKPDYSTFAYFDIVARKV